MDNNLNGNNFQNQNNNNYNQNFNNGNNFQQTSNNMTNQQPNYTQNNYVPQQPLQPNNNMNQPNNNPATGYNQISPNAYLNNINNQMPIVYDNRANGKANKKKIIPILIILLAVIGIIVFLLFNKSNSDDKRVSSGTRTVMIYMVGSDLESEAMAGSLDIEEMVGAQVNTDDVKVIVYAGGTKNWYNGFQNNSMYELTSTGFKEIEKDILKSMGEAATLTYFLDYAYKNYKTDLYDLILWNHGAGPMIGFGVDEINNNDILTLSELDTALKNSPFSNDNKLELIGFDACLMSSVEVAAIFSNYAEFLIASQDIEPGYGWDYSFLNSINKDTTSQEFGKNIIDSYYSFYENKGFTKNYLLTLSLIDLSKMNDVEEKINNLFKDVDGALNSGNYSTIVNQMTKSKCFQCNEYNQSYDLIDLYGAVLELKTSHGTKAKALLDSLDSAIIYQKTNVIGANGLSIYYPYNSPALANRWIATYSQFNFASEYKKFLNNYVLTLLGNKISNWDLKSTNLNISEDGSEISVALDNDVVADYNRSKYVIFKDMKDGYYSPIYTSTDTTLKADGTLVANFNGKIFSLTDSIGDTNWVIANEYQVGEDFTIYSVTTILRYLAEDLSDWKTQISYILVRIDEKNPNGAIIGIIPKPNPEDLNSTKKDIDLKEWSTAEFWQFKYKIFDEKGNYTWDWGSSETHYGFEINPKEDFKIELANLDKEYDYYCLFLIEDTQGNQYTTNLIKIGN